MNIKAIIATTVAIAGVGTGGYFVVKNDVSVDVTVTTPQEELPLGSMDFRDKIDGYESLSLTQKISSLNSIYDSLEGEVKIAANVERERLGKELNERAGFKPHSKATSPGYTPPGWDKE